MDEHIGICMSICGCKDIHICVFVFTLAVCMCGNVCVWVWGACACTNACTQVDLNLPGNGRPGIKDPPFLGHSPIPYHPQPHPFRQISEANQLVVLETF